MTQAQQRRARYDELMGDEHIYDIDSITPDDLGRFLLIERSAFDDDVFVTSWSTPDDAADYHDNQECPDYWPVEKLIDLDTGDELSPTTTTQWSTQ